MRVSPIHTERLTIRMYVSTDAPAVYRMSADAGLMHYFHGSTMTWEETQAHVDAHTGDTATSFALVLRESGAVIGQLNFHLWHQPRTYELGWIIQRDHHGQGFATEGAAALRDYAFGTLAAHRIIATAQPENPASWRVMEKLGMRREAHFRQCIHRGGDVWWDEYFYAMLDSEWQGRQ